MNYLFLFFFNESDNSNQINLLAYVIGFQRVSIFMYI